MREGQRIDTFRDFEIMGDQLSWLERPAAMREGQRIDTFRNFEIMGD
jgi:hypothetical protein